MQEVVEAEAEMDPARREVQNHGFMFGDRLVAPESFMKINKFRNLQLSEKYLVNSISLHRKVNVECKFVFILYNCESTA